MAAPCEHIKLSSFEWNAFCHLAVPKEPPRWACLKYSSRVPCLFSQPGAPGTAMSLCLMSHQAKLWRLCIWPCELLRGQGIQIACRWLSSASPPTVMRRSLLQRVRLTTSSSCQRSSSLAHSATAMSAAVPPVTAQASACPLASHAGRCATGAAQPRGRNAPDH